VTPTCPYCRAPFLPDEIVVVCPGCATTHHADCLEENHGCTIFGCAHAPLEEPKVSVSSHDLTNPTPLASEAPRAAVPPPPRPTGAPPPPPRPLPASLEGFAPIRTGAVTTAPTLAFAGYATTSAPIDYNSRYLVRKSRVGYVLFAIFLGAFGAHNFYAGYVKKAVIQCCLTVLTFFMASPFVWVWALVEACLVEQDADGVKFN